MYVCRHCAQFVNYKYMFMGANKANKSGTLWSSQQNKKVFPQGVLYTVRTETEDTNPPRGMLITLDLVSQTKAQQSCLTKTMVIHLVAVGCWYIIVFCPQVGCCNYIVHVEITVIILEHKNKKRAYGNV